jgi:hypothetical protein
MREPRVDCPRCGRRMEEGFLLEKGNHDQASQTRWVAGPPERSRWTGLKLKGRMVLRVVTCRCTGCGHLESVAPAE